MNSRFIQRLQQEAKKNRIAEIVIFGSRAALVNRRNSDWDILLVGFGEFGPIPNNVDLVNISYEQVLSREWLGSELAGHIAAYGQWITGSSSWAASTFFSAESRRRKATRIVRRFSTILERWNDMTAEHQNRMAILVRRDIQRYKCLVSGRAVPPGAILDIEFGDASKQNKHSDMLSWIESEILTSIATAQNISDQTSRRLHAALGQSNLFSGCAAAPAPARAR